MWGAPTGAVGGCIGLNVNSVSVQSHTVEHVSSSGGFDAAED
jgi:hypothetical protein